MLDYYSVNLSRSDYLILILNMGIVLITISFLSTFYRLACEKTGDDGFRSAFLQASVGHGVIIVLSTEALSVFRQLNFMSLCIFWGLMAAINIALLFTINTSQNCRFKLSVNLKLIFHNSIGKPLASKITTAGVLAILIICLLTALLAPPNNYDSMTYHLARVMHWIQNQSVAHYPTHNLRQISFPPGTSYIVAQLQILSGSDYFANAVQWFAFLGCIFGTSLLSKCFGRSEDQQTTALVCASIPMAIMQATTTQTDLAASYWVICFAYFIFRTDKYLKTDFFWLTASLGLAILAKPTATIFSIPLIGILMIRHSGGILALRKLKILFRSICFTFLVSVSALLLSFPYFWRNIQIFGFFLGIDNGTRVESIGLDIFISNILRNLALNLPLKLLWQSIIKLHEWILLLDVNDPRTTFLHSEFNLTFLQRLILPDEDFVSNPIHLIFIICTIGTFLILFLSRKANVIPRIAQLSVCSVFGFMLYCFLIKWQTWANRLLLPFFILNAPLVAFFINRFVSKNARIILIGVIVLISVFYSLTPIHHPLIALPQKWTHRSQSASILTLNREDIYHSSYGKEIKSAYVLLRNHVLDKNCKFVGLNIGDDDCEYPIWATLMSQGIDSFMIKHVNVQNASQNADNAFPDDKICVLFEKKRRRIKIYTQQASATQVHSP